MSKKNLILVLLICTFFSCSETKTNSSASDENKSIVYYLATDVHIGYPIKTPIFSLNYSVGELTQINVLKDEIIYTLHFNQQHVVFSDSEILLDVSQITIDNKNSVGQPLPLGDTIRIKLTRTFPKNIEKESITQDDLDSLQQRINKLTQLIEELDGTH
jgi:hypothetical protein